MILRVTLALIAVFACFAQVRSQVKVEVGDVKEQRRTDGFFNDLNIDLKLGGPVLKNAKAARITVDRAVDDTGKDLISDKTTDKAFKEISSFDSRSEDTTRIEVDLKNSERRATVVKELAGTIELFDPTRDPQSTISISNFQAAIGKPLTNPLLRSAGVEVTVWTKEMFDAPSHMNE